MDLHFQKIAFKITFLFLFDDAKIDVVRCFEVKKNCHKCENYWSGVANESITSALFTDMFVL